jgi:hypothetical protein
MALDVGAPLGTALRLGSRLMLVVAVGSRLVLGSLLTLGADGAEELRLG